MAVTSSHIYMSDAQGNIKKYVKSGISRNSSSLTDVSVTAMSSPGGLAIDADGVLIVADSDGGNGLVKAQYASAVTNTPIAMAYDSDRDVIWVVSAGSGGNDQLIKVSKTDASDAGSGIAIDTGTTDAAGLAYRNDTLYVSVGTAQSGWDNYPAFKSYDIENASWGSVVAADGVNCCNNKMGGATMKGSKLSFVLSSEDRRYNVSTSNGSTDEDAEWGWSGSFTISSGASAAAYRLSLIHI